MPARSEEKGLAKEHRPGEELFRFIQPLDYNPHCSSKWVPVMWPGRARMCLE